MWTSQDVNPGLWLLRQRQAAGRPAYCVFVTVVAKYVQKQSNLPSFGNVDQHNVSKCVHLEKNSKNNSSFIFSPKKTYPSLTFCSSFGSAFKWCVKFKMKFCLQLATEGTSLATNLPHPPPQMGPRPHPQQYPLRPRPLTWRFRRWSGASKKSLIMDYYMSVVSPLNFGQSLVPCGRPRTSTRLWLPPAAPGGCSARLTKSLLQLSQITYKNKTKQLTYFCVMEKAFHTKFACVCIWRKIQKTTQVSFFPQKTYPSCRSPTLCSSLGSPSNTTKTPSPAAAPASTPHTPTLATPPLPASTSSLQSPQPSTSVALPASTPSTRAPRPKGGQAKPRARQAGPSTPAGDVVPRWNPRWACKKV